MYFGQLVQLRSLVARGVHDDRRTGVPQRVADLGEAGGWPATPRIGSAEVKHGNSLAGGHDGTGGSEILVRDAYPRLPAGRLRTGQRHDFEIAENLGLVIDIGD